MKQGLEEFLAFPFFKSSFLQLRAPNDDLFICSPCTFQVLLFCIKKNVVFAGLLGVLLIGKDREFTQKVREFNVLAHSRSECNSRGNKLKWMFFSFVREEQKEPGK